MFIIEPLGKDKIEHLGVYRAPICFTILICKFI